MVDSRRFAHPSREPGGARRRKIHRSHRSLRAGPVARTKFLGDYVAESPNMRGMSSTGAV